jgi:beta-phosphoglucomutase
VAPRRSDPIEARGPRRETVPDTIRALIFDFNGALVDDEPRHCALVHEILAQEGIALSEPQYAERYLGFDDRRCFEAALSDAGREADRNLVEDMIALYAKVAETGLRFFPGVA